MDGSREEVENSPDYQIGVMGVEGDSDWEQYVSDDMSGEHVDEQSSTNQACSSAAVHPLPIDVPEEEVEASLSDEEDEAEEQGGNENLSEKESMSEGRVHPLLIPDVTKGIFNHLPANDLQKCRLVCRAWNAEASTALQTKRLVVFMDANAVRVYNNAMRNTTYFPHAQYEFCIEDFTGLSDENLREFWTLFGRHIKSLEFRQKRMLWSDLLEVVGKKTPRLEKLFLRHLPTNIDNCNVTTENNRIPSVKELRLASLPSSTIAAMERLTELLKSLPNLEVIEFLPIKSFELKIRVSSILMFILGLPDVKFPHLKMINLSLQLSDDRAEGLAKKQFQLEHLDITLADGVEATSFNKLLDSLRPTLSELKIFITECESVVNYNYLMKPVECVQVLSNLRTLSLTNYNGSINFVQNLPKLQQLHLTTTNLENCIPFRFQMVNDPSSGVDSSKIAGHSLKFLKIESTCPISGTLAMESISTCFPHLTCLHLQGIDDDGLGVIYRNLPLLSDVEFTNATCTDQGLTGIPLEIFNEILEDSTRTEKQPELYRQDLYIGNLLYLQKFSIVGTEISDASLAFGVLDCKNLKDLKIGSPRITDAGVYLVTHKFYKQINILDVTECANLSEFCISYAREELLGELKAADSSRDSQNQATRIKNEVVLNADRVIVKTKKVTTSSFRSLVRSSYSKYFVEDTEFFEEDYDFDIRDRDLPHGVFSDDADDNGRIFRIRRALRQNGDLMRTLQRMDLQQFRRLYEREFQKVKADHPPAPERKRPRVLTRNRQNDRAIQQVILRLFEWYDGGQAEVNMEPDRPPENIISDIFSLDLRLGDVEYLLRNPLLFEREENNGNPNVDPPIVRNDQEGDFLAEIDSVGRYLQENGWY